MRLLKAYSHLYFVPVTTFKTVATELSCDACGHRFGGAAIGLVTTKRRDLTLDELIALTNPGVGDEAARISDFFERAAAGQLSEEERLAAVTDLFAVICLPLSQRVAGFYVDAHSARHLLAGVAAAGAAIAAWSLVSIPPPLGTCIGALVAIPWLTFLWSVHTDARRFLHRKLLPGMAVQLTALEVTEADLRGLRRSLRKAKVPASRAIKPKQLLRHLQQFQKRVAADQNIEADHHVSQAA